MHLFVQYGEKMPLVVELRTVIGNAQFLDAPNCTCVLDGDSGIVSDGPKKEFVLLIDLQVNSEQLNDAEDASDTANWQAYHGRLIGQRRIDCVLRDTCIHAKV